MGQAYEEEVPPCEGSANPKKLGKIEGSRMPLKPNHGLCFSLSNEAGIEKYLVTGATRCARDEQRLFYFCYIVIERDTRF